MDVTEKIPAVTSIITPMLSSQVNAASPTSHYLVTHNAPARCMGIIFSARSLFTGMHEGYRRTACSPLWFICVKPRLFLHYT